MLHIVIVSLHPLGINYRREYCNSMSIVYYNFICQVHNLLNDVSTWGDESDFKGAVKMDDPFSNEPICADGSVEKLLMLNGTRKQMHNASNCALVNHTLFF